MDSFPVPKHGRCASLRFFNSLFRSQRTSLAPALRALGLLPTKREKPPYTSISATICFERLAAAFIPRVCLADLHDSIPDDINIFPMLYHGRALTQQVYLIHLKDRYLPRPFHYFQTLLSEYYRDVETIGLERVV